MSSPRQSFNNGQSEHTQPPRGQNKNDSNKNSNGRESTNSSKNTGRVRSACNACHQSKIRCSGGAPCQPCRESMFLCTYSPGRRLGRPKGSKNKRTLMQGNNKQKQAEAPAPAPEPAVAENNNDKKGSDSTSTTSNSMAPLTSHAESSMDLEFDLDESTTGLGLDDEIDFDQSALLGMSSSMSSLFGSMGTDSRSMSLDNKPGDTNSTKWMSALSSPYRGPSTFDTSDVFKGPSGTGATITHQASLTPIDPALAGLFQTSQGSSSAEPSSGSAVTSGWPSSTTTVSSPLCSCIQQHARLVYDLGTLLHDKATDVERILTGVQLAQGPWQTLLQCPWGRHCDNHKEAFLLFSLSVRILLSSLQKVQSGVKALSRPGSSERGPAPMDVGLGSLAASSLALSGDLDGTRVSVGGFEVTGETKLEVISVLIKGALESILSTVSNQQDTGVAMPIDTTTLCSLPPYLVNMAMPGGGSDSEKGSSESPISARTSVSAEAAQLSSQLFNMSHLHQTPDAGIAHIDAAANDIQALLNQLTRG